jgi:hypothetical protein
MIKSTRTKRRKIKNELDILQEIGVSRILDEENTYVLGYQEIETHPVSSSINFSQDSLNLIPQNIPINSNMIEILSIYIYIYIYFIYYLYINII